MSAARPLTGLMVLALEQAVAAPYCSSRLADAGARVIKIERAEGDFARAFDASVNGLAGYFVWLNRGKKSLVADIKDPADIALQHGILARTDVFIQNLAPGAAARAGFGSAVLRKRHPRLITVDISGYGSNNSYSDMKAYDLLIQAECGLASITGHPAGPGRIACGRPGIRARRWHSPISARPTCGGTTSRSSSSGRTADRRTDVGAASHAAARGG